MTMFVKVQTLGTMFRDIAKMFVDVCICPCMFGHLG
jgi:hypothetical protein